MVEAYAIFILLIVVPTRRILTRAGFSPLLAFLLLIPGFGFFVILFILTFRPWPNAGALEPSEREPDYG